MIDARSLLRKGIHPSARLNHSVTTYRYNTMYSYVPILCPVGNFHVRNGAEVYRVNFLADKTTRGMSNSLGTMVNYRYNFEAVETNRARYVARGEIAYGSEFDKMVLPKRGPCVVLLKNNNI